MSQDPINISSERLLLCEGKTTLLVLGPFCRKMDIQGFQPLDFGSKDNFGNFLKDVTILPGFEAQVHTLAVVRDAEHDAAAAFASVRHALIEVGLPAPNAPGEVAGDDRRVGVFIVPDNADSGMIETLCLRSVASDPAFSCLDEFFECVFQRVGMPPSNMHKARAQAFLATRQKVDYHVGRAADAGVWNFEHEAFAPLEKFLRGLAG
ncbi:MAG TPA: DUF3226 domain-containing protein [Chthoniobacterales bacterium]|nr:DUF3226 domain-containing protein [Chthoniobacterales bacterium]